MLYSTPSPTPTPCDVVAIALQPGRATGRRLCFAASIFCIPLMSAGVKGHMEKCASDNAKDLKNFTAHHSPIRKLLSDYGVIGARRHLQYMPIW